MTLRFIVGRVETRDDQEYVHGVFEIGTGLFAGTGTFRLAPVAFGSLSPGNSVVLVDGKAT